MFFKRVVLLLSLLVYAHFGFAQLTKKKLTTRFTSEKILIDGNLNEEIWKSAEIATDFVMYEPDNGTPESVDRKSEVKVVYDHEAIYVGAILYDSNPENIKRELSNRDDFATADHFGIMLNGYNDGQQDFRFYVSAAGVQMDCVYTEYNGEDFTWNAIWDSHVHITDYGWVVEMKIPYAALRFPTDKKQTWGVNFYREVRNNRQTFTWNLLSNTINNEAVQAGILEGIENIETPTRLFFIPYVSQYFNANDAYKTKGEFKGGMDIKYGINDAFTLDAILVPDFGQTTFDRVELNLGPFEQQFNENRPFFTEGTELFSKGNLVYTRRIGGNPSRSASLNTNEEYLENPSKVKLLNALKISGRTKKGLGIGFLNAVTEKTEADIVNTATGETRSELIEPLANYSVFVLDQRFRKNSSVSLINTNVTRNGEFRDANVTALVWDLNNKTNAFNISGDYKYSYINNDALQPDSKGYSTSLFFGDTSGKYRWGVNSQYISSDYDPNDLGINFQNHYHSVSASGSYRILKPTKRLNSFNVNQNHYYEFDNRTGRVQSANFSLNFNMVSRKNDYLGFGFGLRPLDVYDFYEPRTEGEQKFLTQPRNIRGWIFVSTNYNRKFALDLSPYFARFDQENRYEFSNSLTPRYRFSNKFSVIYDFTYNYQNNNIGYVSEDTTLQQIYMGRRNRTTISNSLSGKFTLNNLMNLNLSVRHYWSYAIYNRFFNLNDDGSLTDNLSYSDNENQNFSTWNLDLSYSWWFAPGSQMSILYRNSSFGFQQGTDINRDFGYNIKNNLNNTVLDHIFSVSVRYFIDYNTLKRKK